MTNNFNPDEEAATGSWRAYIKTGRKAILVVHGVVSATAGIASFSLQKAGPEPANPSVLVLELRPDLTPFDGRITAAMYYSEVIDNYDQYDAVLVRGNGRDLAFFEIEKPN